MKFLKKVGAALVSCAMLAATAIPATADEAYMKLLTVPVSELTGYNGYLYNGIGIFNDGSEFWRIDTQQWRESGEISYAAVSLDDELRGIEHLEAFSDMRFNTENDYAMFASLDENDSISQRLVVKYNGESNSLETVSKYDDWCYVTEDGYVVTLVRNEEIGTVLITAPDGTEKSLEFQGCRLDNGECYTTSLSVVRGCDKYIAYVLNPASVRKDEEQSADLGYDLYYWDMEAYGIDRNGNIDLLFKETCNFWGSNSAGDNYFLFQSQTRPVDEKYHIYVTDTDEMFELGGMDDATYLYASDGVEFGGAEIASLGNKIYGTKAIAYAEPWQKLNDEWYGTYALIDIKTGKKIGDYDYMKSISTNDGKMYLVQTADDKWGFMNSKGKVLRTYDYASSFIGDYAPVIKDGKAFLVDRSLKRVSEKIDADYVGTIEEDLYWIKNGDEYYFMTFSNGMTETPVKDNEEPTEDPAEPTEEPVEEPTETEAPEEPETIVIEEPETEAPETPAEPAPAESAPTANTAANKGNPDTGAAVAVIPLLIAGAGTAVLTRKRK